MYKPKIWQNLLEVKQILPILNPKSCSLAKKDINWDFLPEFRPFRISPLLLERVSVSSVIQNTEKWVGKTRCYRVILTDFEMFGYLMKNPFEWKIYVKIGCPNNRHAYDFLCSNLMEINEFENRRGNLELTAVKRQRRFSFYLVGFF